MNPIYGNDLSLSEKALDLMWERQNLTSNNIANVDTPGYKAKSLSFEGSLSEAVRRGKRTGDKNPASTMEENLSTVRGQVKESRNESSRLDGNNVDMDQEQVDLVKNTYQYEMMVNSTNNTLKRLEEAAKSF